MPQDADVRASFLRFPGWTQHFWTWLTGKALPGQQPLVRQTWYSYLGLTLATFFAGLALSSAAVMDRFPFWWLALPCGWLLTVAAARSMILVIAHQCIHKQFSGRPRLDAAIGELVTVLTVYQDAHAFKVEHFDAHHRHAIFATREDPPVQVLIGLGFRPGMSKAQLWRRAALVFVSPAFYVRGFADRLACNLLEGRWRRVGFFAWAGWWLSLPFWLPHGLSVLVLAFFVPIVPLAQLSALLDKLGEHAWLTEPDPEHGRRYYHAAASWARFCGCAVPPASLALREQLRAWPVWVLTMMLYHVPARFLVVVGDLPNHDFHHRYPGTTDWMVAAYARQHDIDAGCAGGPPYREVWGMAHAVDRMFETLSQLPPGPVAPRATGPAQQPVVTS